jgi:hypothetical protein
MAKTGRVIGIRNGRWLVEEAHDYCEFCCKRRPVRLLHRMSDGAYRCQIAEVTGGITRLECEP